MKVTKPYFSHDEGARNDPKLVKVLMRLGQAGKGVYWDLVEMLYEQGGYLLMEECESYAFALRTDCELIKKLVNEFELFATDGTRFWSETCLERMQMRSAKAEARALAGAKGGKIKAEREAAAKALLEQDRSNASDNSSIATALPPEILASKGKEIKGKEIKEEPSSLCSEDAPTQKKIGVVEPLLENPDEAQAPPPVAKPPRFSPPTEALVQSYMLTQRPNNPGPIAGEAERFIGYYQSNGWKVGRNPMKDWEAACRNWLTKVPKDAPGGAVGRVLPPQSFGTAYGRPPSQVTIRTAAIAQADALVDAMGGNYKPYDLSKP